MHFVGRVHEGCTAGHGVFIAAMASICNSKKPPAFQPLQSPARLPAGNQRLHALVQPAEM
jgi:hypothetical protein